MLKITDPHHLLNSAALAKIEEELPALAEVMPATAETIQLLVNNVRSGRIAIGAAIKLAGLDQL